MLMDEPRRPYAEISRDTGLPIGSIGPTRARCLARLRLQLAELGVDHL
jgi:DNA-directed RNA polymerase specialized sigma24 family protein